MVNRFDKGLLIIGFIFMVAAFLVFTTSKRDGQDFRNIVAQIKFLKNTVQTKMAGSVAWYTGEEEEKINAYGLGLTGTSSSARYLYLNKTQIISLDDSLIEFLPDEEIKMDKGQIMVLNPDGKLRLTDSKGNSVVAKENMMYTATEKGISGSPATWEKGWVTEGESYSVVYKDGELSELFLLAPPLLAIDRFGSTCVGKLQPIDGDAGDVSYEMKANGATQKLTGTEITLPTNRTDIEIRSLAGGTSSVWRTIKLPEHCITELVEEQPVVTAPVLQEDLRFFRTANETIMLNEMDDVHKLMVSYVVDGTGVFEIKGHDLNRKANISGEFKKEYTLTPGTYSFKFTQDNKVLIRNIEVKVKPPFKIKDSILIEEE